MWSTRIFNLFHLRPQNVSFIRITFFHEGNRFQHSLFLLFFKPQKEKKDEEAGRTEDKARISIPMVHCVVAPKRLLGRRLSFTTRNTIHYWLTGLKSLACKIVVGHFAGIRWWHRARQEIGAENWREAEKRLPADVLLVRCHWKRETIIFS